jgi:acyl-coenzyme A thioesterase PaaI-like protein
MPPDLPAAELTDLMAEIRARPPDERDTARRRAAAALRTLNEIVLTGDIDHAGLAQLAARLDAVVENTSLKPGLSRYGAASEGPSVIYLMNETHPIGGLGNPVAAPFTPSFDGDTIRGEFRFPLTFEGTPGLVHGGFVAATFDHLLGGAAIRSGHPIVTGTLTIRYLRPTPTNTDLVIECWPGEVRGRKVMTHGRLRNGDEVLVEADALFITVDVGRYTPPED